mmetsp:Transcript_4369/g.7381  ORF Transcript_4369/g.7381 Transcript_4369/m.7381 type:complete len:135 (+) Transcript_4369:283-687(+)
MSSSWYKSQREFDGILSSDEQTNPLAKANKVYLPYCTSDGHMGDSSNSHWTKGFQFRGRRVVNALFDTLVSSFFEKESDRPVTVVFGGFSAGARGAMMHIDSLSARLSNFDNLQVVGVLDSPAYLDVETLDPRS